MFRALIFALASSVESTVLLRGARQTPLIPAIRVASRARFQPPVLPQSKLALMPLIIPGVRTISDAALFPAVNLVLPAWLLLIFLPKWKYTTPVVKYTALSFAALYVLLMVPLLCCSGGAGFSQMGSLKGITALFAKESAVMVGWVHYVVFDLWTAQHIVHDARKIYVDRVGNVWKIPHVAVVPCLLATLLAGPAGLLGYYLLREACFAYRKSSFIKRAGSY